METVQNTFERYAETTREEPLNGKRPLEISLASGEDVVSKAGRPKGTEGRAAAAVTPAASPDACWSSDAGALGGGGGDGNDCSCGGGDCAGWSGASDALDTPSPKVRREVGFGGPPAVHR